MRRLLLALAVGSFFLALLVPEAEARRTNRYYPDLSATSPNERYVVTATSEDNQPGSKARARWNVPDDHSVPFASDFTYTLLDTANDREVWERQQSPSEGSPRRIFVSDEGWVVAWLERDRLIVLEPEAGKRLLRLSIFAQFSHEERDRYVPWTAVGNFWPRGSSPSKWAWGSQWFFAQHEDRPMFIVRTHWGREIIVDLERGEVIKDPPEALAKSLADEQRRRTIETLRTAAEQQHADPDNWNPRFNLITAILTASRLQLRETIPFLRELEGCTDALYCQYDIEAIFDKDKDPGLKPRGTHCFLGVRAAAQLALRRLGETPEGYPCVFFVRPDHETYFESADIIGAQVDYIDHIEEGMSPEAVLKTIGGPTALVHASWDYDIDADEPYTLRITWDEEGKVENTKRIVPPVWAEHGPRDTVLTGGF